MLGEEAAKLRAVLELSHPLDNGIIKDWDMMVKLWEYGFHDRVELCELTHIDENSTEGHGRYENPADRGPAESERK